jgi:hypothetical protein
MRYAEVLDEVIPPDAGIQVFFCRIAGRELDEVILAYARKARFFPGRMASAENMTSPKKIRMLFFCKTNRRSCLESTKHLLKNVKRTGKWPEKRRNVDLLSYLK